MSLSANNGGVLKTSCFSSFPGYVYTKTDACIWKYEHVSLNVKVKPNIFFPHCRALFASASSWQPQYKLHCYVLWLRKLHVRLSDDNKNTTPHFWLKQIPRGWWLVILSFAVPHLWMIFCIVSASCIFRGCLADLRLVWTGWGSSTTETPWSSVITTMLDSVPREASGCLFSTLRLVWLRATVTFGWRRDTGAQVRGKMWTMTGRKNPNFQVGKILFDEISHNNILLAYDSD